VQSVRDVRNAKSHTGHMWDGEIARPQRVASARTSLLLSSWNLWTSSSSILLLLASFLYDKVQNLVQPSFMPTNNVQALLSTNIPDPSDFPMPDLQQLDASLRCTICGELYDAPITLACGHCFCSLVGALPPFSCSLLSECCR